jgi:hypothetical protein
MHLTAKTGLRKIRCAIKDRSGLAAIEFAVSVPIILAMATMGIETANMATTNMKVSELAVSVADNASRLGQTDNSGVSPSVTEGDIDTIMFGALKQGSSIDFEENGRVILSSLERDAATGKQYIHWQRCRGNLDRQSKYGNETTDNGLNGDAIAGLGSSGQIVANAGSAVMFVEVFYKYEGVFASLLTEDMQFRQEAAFIIRDDRDLGPGVTGAGGASHC